jgi:hypothetical protein
MAIHENAVIALLVIILAIGISAVIWKGKEIVKVFANRMFAARQAAREHRENQASEESV